MDEQHTDNNQTGKQTEPAANVKPRKRHLIRHGWIRIPLKVLMWLIIAVLLLPALLYVPPVQNFVKNIACSQIKKSTGMDIEIGRLLLKFPLDVQLDDVLVKEAAGDTMVKARSLVADVMARPLLALDIKFKALRLDDGYYRMLSADSSMIMKINAGLLNVEPGASFDLKTSKLNIEDALMKDGNVQLYMNVWKKQPSADTTSSSPFLIKAKRLRLENFTFGMSMLPTIDTLSFKARNLSLTDGVIDLGKSKITMGTVRAGDGAATYLVPTPEYIASHPAPPADTTSSSAPMVIMADTIALERFAARYAVKDAKPLPGFDASNIEFSDLGITLADFYNESSTVRLPIASLHGKERCGLDITSGKGTVLVDSTGLSLDGLEVRTLFSTLKATAGLPFALMEMKNSAPVDASANLSLGIPDIEAFMPSLKAYTSKIPGRAPLLADIDVRGKLDNIDIRRLDISMTNLLSLEATGTARNVLDPDRLGGNLTFNGSLKNPKVAESFTGSIEGVRIPSFNIKGKAVADRKNYGAEFALTTPDGKLGAKGRVSLTPEKYNADVTVDELNVGAIMPSLGIGVVDGTLSAHGAGFNPERPNAATDIQLRLNHIDYNKTRLSGISADLTLNDGEFMVDAVSRAQEADMTLSGSGRIAEDDYELDLTAHINHLNLQSLGMSEVLNEGSGTIRVSGTASPRRWIYDARLTAENIDWSLDVDNYHLPEGVQLDLKSTEFATLACLTARGTEVRFSSQSGLQGVVDGFSRAAAMAENQIARRDIQVDSLHSVLPPFRLDANVDGTGLIGNLLEPNGMAIQSLSATLVNDTVIAANIGAVNFSNESLSLDTIGLGLKQRGNLIDYWAHTGNRPGTLDEFANVNASGYLGANRLSCYLIQRNINGETGYRLGFTAAMADSVVTVHFTPLQATIAYLPWKFNMENYVDYNLFTRQIKADMTANSAESSILIRTEPFATVKRDQDGRPIAGADSIRGDELHIKLNNIIVQDLLRMSPTALPITGKLDSDIRVFYDGQNLMGRGTIDFDNFYYDRQRVGNFHLGLMAGLESSGKTRAAARLRVDSIEALTLYTRLVPDTAAGGGLEPEELRLKINRLPLEMANPFLGPDLAQLGGILKGDMQVSGKLTAPVLDGKLNFDDASVFIPMIGTRLTLDSVNIPVKESVVSFNAFDIWGVNRNPLTINGKVDVTDFTNIGIDLSASASNMQIVGTGKQARSDVYGKAFIDMGATVKGSTRMMDINATLNLLSQTDVTYVMDSEAMLQQTQAEDVVKFVSFSDSLQVVKADSIEPKMLMRISAGLTLSQGCRVTVLLDAGGSNRVELTPSGSLRFTQNYMGEMRLNGQLALGTGFFRYGIPVIGDKRFDFVQGSYVAFNGPIDNPTLAISANDRMKVNVQTGSSARMVNFDVGLNVTNNLASPKVLFDLTTDDDMTIANELASLSPDQRSTTAMNLLITGQYTGPGAKTVNNNFVTGQALGLLTSQINAWTAKAIKGIDLSFGVDQYQSGENGQNQTATSYSYQLSKSLFNNRFKIIVGGNYSTDASSDENLEQNLVSDISFEYIFMQNNNMSLAGKLYRHYGYENILEGEITEMGLGVILRRRLQSLRGLFRFRRRNRNKTKTDTVTVHLDSAVAKLEDAPVNIGDKEEKGGDK